MDCWTVSLRRSVSACLAANYYAKFWGSMG